MYARHEWSLNEARAEAGLLVALLACLAILLQGTPDSLEVFGVVVAGFVVCQRRLLCTFAARAAVCSSARRERSVFPLTVITPRGLGILSLRYA